MKNVKILSMIVWFAAILSWVSAFNTNFYFAPASGTNLKLYCETPIYFMINWWTDKLSDVVRNLYDRAGKGTFRETDSWQNGKCSCSWKEVYEGCKK